MNRSACPVIPATCPYSGANKRTDKRTDKPTDKPTPKENANPEDNYEDYLKLDGLLSCQTRRMEGKAAHDEHLFIVIHQNYELWFKQILYEITSVIEHLDVPVVCERNQHLILQRMIRVNCILRCMVQQFEILETMSCVGFASFRDIFKKGASGFQSTQFRKLEITLGIKEAQRTCTFLKQYNARLTQEQRDNIEEHQEKCVDLFTVVNKWLERTPAIKLFTTAYRNQIEQEVQCMRREAEEAESDEEKEALLREANDTTQRFSILFDSSTYQTESAKRNVKLSYEAFIGALMINMYSNEPRFSVPYEILKCLIDMDVFITKWRFAHAMMAKRMLGGKPGTGGSGGYSYLRSTVSERYMTFKDLFEVAEYVLPPQKAPKLTPMMLRQLREVYVNSQEDESKSEDSSGFSSS